MDEVEKKELEEYRRLYGPIIKERGIHNWRNLFKKPSRSDWIVFICLVFTLLLALSYKMDIKNCHLQIEDILENPYNYSQYFNWANNDENTRNTMPVSVPLQIVQGDIT